MKLLFLTLLAAGCAMAQLDAPSIGCVRDAGGAWHAVYGVAGSFVLGPETEEPAQIDLNDVLAQQVVKLYATGEDLILRRADGNEFHFPLAGEVDLRAMSPEYVQVSASGREYVLRLSKGHEAIFLLPGGGQ